jgi:hypothetical protein
VALNAVRRAAALLACTVVLAAAGCGKAPPAADDKKPVAAATSGSENRGIATYAVVGSSRANGVVTYRLANPKGRRAALELFVADSSGPAYRDAVSAVTHKVAIAPDGVVLHAIGVAGAQEQRAFLRAMRSPAPKRPLRASSTFTAVLFDDNHTSESTNGKPSRLYKLFGMFRDDDDVELYLAIAADGSSVTFSEKDPDYRPNLTRFLST